MAVWVRVLRQDGGGIGENFYVEGNYQQPAGTIGIVASSETGFITFETLDANGDPDWRAAVDIVETPGNDQNHPATVTLQRIAVV